MNGQPVATNDNMTLNPAALGDTDQDWIGRSQFSGDPYLAATVDDFQIYDHALSAADIAALASGQPGAGQRRLRTSSTRTPVRPRWTRRATAATRTIISAGNVSTPLWQPVPDGPITVPAGSTNVPVTSTSGFKVGQKMAIGYGRTFETATVTAVGTPGTQDGLAAAASAGATNIKVTSTSNITAGDTIRLDIGQQDRERHRRVGGYLRRWRHRPHPDRPAEVRPRVQPSLQRPGHRHHLQPGDPLRALEQRARAGAGQQHHPRQSPPPQPRDQRPGGRRRGHDRGLPGVTGTRPVVRRPRPVHERRQHGAARRQGPGRGQPQLRRSRRPAGRRGLPGRVRDGAGRLLRALARRGQRRRRSDVRLPDGNDTDSNCADFAVTNDPTPGAANQGFTLDPGPLVSLQATDNGASSGYIKHDDSDDLVVVAPVTAASSSTDKQDATFVEAAGLANPSCVSFESINKPGSYLRHQNFQFHLQPNDGSSLFAMDATFCPGTGNSGQGTSFQSVNFPGRYIRNFNNVVYLAANGGSNPWDTATGWPVDTSWLVATPWAQPPGGTSRNRPLSQARSRR